MPSVATPLEQRLSETRWRLLVQELLENLVAAWLAALVVAGVWFLLQPWVLPYSPSAGRTTVLGTLFGMATVAALVRTWRRRPTPIRAALEVDARYRLQERVVTGFLLSPEEAGTPAGQALLADVNQRVQPLRMSEQFPVRLPTTAWFLPVGALVVALLLLLYRPQPSQAVAATEDHPLAVEDRLLAQIEEKKKELIRKKDPEKGHEKVSAELQKIREQAEQIGRRSTETREQARDALQEIGQLEEEIQKRQKELARKQDAFAKQLEEVARDAEKKDPERLRKKNPKQDPAADLNRAIQQGDLDQARDEADRLFRKVDPDEARQAAQREADLARREGELQRELEQPNLPPEDREKLKKEWEKLRQEQQDLADQKLTPEQRRELQKTLEDIARDLKTLAEEQEKKNLELAQQQKELEEKLAQAQTPEEKDRLRQQLDQVEQKRQECLDGEGCKDARNLAKKFDEAKKALEQGNDGEAAKKLQEAADQMAKMGAGAERKELADQKGKAGQARRALALALDADGKQPGQGGPNSRPGPGGPATGARAESKTGVTQEKEQRSRSQLSKGRQSILDFVPGEGLKEPFNPGAHVEVIRQAAREAPEAIDRQQLPRGASDMVRRYFEKFRVPEKGKDPPMK